MLIQGWDGDWNGKASEISPLNENDLDSEWVGHFIFVINKQQLEIEIIAAKHYELSLNTIDIKNTINTKKKVASELKGLWSSNKEYLDISHIFENSVLKQRIVDIELTVGNWNNEYQYLENLIIRFENGKALLIEEGIDNSVIHFL